MLRLSKLSALIALSSLSACTIVPTGPSVLVLPGTGKPFDQFRADDVVCRQFAASQVGGETPASSAAQSGLTSAAVGTALGAATGAAIGGGEGAAIGAGAGLAAGGLAGTGAATSSSYEAQRRYDIGYIQCMYAKGNRVPVSGQLLYEDRKEWHPPPPPPPETAPH